MRTCDVAVVGGGPAGATAGRSLADAGWDVLVIEGERHPRDKVCGGGLRPSVLTAFPHVEALKGRFLEATSTHGIMATPGADELSYRMPEGRVMMHQVRRSVFDRVLLDDAVDQGATLLEGQRVASAAGGGDGWLLRLEDGEEVRARGVIGAGGARCPIGRRLRAAARGSPTFPQERLAVAWSREFEVGEVFVEEAYGPGRTVRIDLREGGVTGYAWAFPKREHVNVGFGALVGELNGGIGWDRAEAYADRLVATGLLPERPVGGSWRAAPIPMGGPAGPVSRPGALSVGDCVGLVSPLSGDGIYYALRSGSIAAMTMDGALEKGDLSARAMAVYGRAFKRAFDRELTLLARIASRMRSDPVEMMTRAAKDPSIPPLVVQMFQGEGNLSAAALRLYGRTLMAGLR